MADIGQEELQYEESHDVELKEDAAMEDVHLNETDQSIETELEAIKARVREMEEEAEKIRQIQTEVDKQMGSPPGGTAAATPVVLSLEDKMEIDARSIYVGNVDYNTTAEELEQHFHGCGAVNRVTILCNKFDGHPKGFAYVEFSDKDSIQLAMSLDDTVFRGRLLKVMPKRTNKPGVSSTNRFPRGARRRSRTRGFRQYAARPYRGRKYFSPY